MRKMFQLQIGSVTYAVKAKELLLQNGIRARLIKTPNPAKEEGCGYCLVVPAPPQPAVSLLQRAGIPVRGTKWVP